MNFHKLSRRAARYEHARAYAADIPGYIACVIAGATLWLGMAYAGPITKLIGG